jgi:tripartite-type tricarboxylate transporter receptor subunit TctC
LPEELALKPFGSGLRAFAFFAAACAAIGPAVAQQNFPDHPMRIVVAFPPGGATDILARDISQRFNAKWGQPAVVDNRPGANGNIGAELVSKSRPDGHTLLIQPANIAISATLYKNLGYDVLKDLAPVSMLATGPYLMIVPPALPVRTLKDFIALAKARPNQLTMASSGTGSPGHLAGEVLLATVGVKLTHVPYKGQTAGLVDLIGGQVTLFFASAPVGAPHVSSGKVRALAVTTAKRAAILPEVPTVAESGFPGFNVGAWHGAFVPARTPPEIIAKLNEELGVFLRAPDAKKTYAQQGLDLVPSTPEEFGKFVRAEILLYGKVTSTLNVQVD